MTATPLTLDDYMDEVSYAATYSIDCGTYDNYASWDAVIWDMQNDENIFETDYYPDYASPYSDDFSIVTSIIASDDELINEISDYLDDEDIPHYTPQEMDRQIRYYCLQMLSDDLEAYWLSQTNNR